MKPEEPPLITSREPGNVESSEQGVSDAGYIAPLFEENLASQINCQEQVNPDLEAFREEWKQEIGIKEATSQRGAGGERNVEEEAKSLFLRGVESEKRGDMSEAVRQYASAMKLVPDIERRVHPLNPAPPRARSTSRVRAGSNPLATTGNNLIHTFQQRIAERGQLFLHTSEGSCQLGSLPVEILHLIMRYVVSSEMNLRHLETLSEVSAMMYLLARDDDLWRKIHARSCGEAPPRQTEEVSPIPWRERYLSSPHLQFEGVYISKITYIRHGEQQFQDNNYRPWHTVTYFRMMRFFPDGKILMMTSSDSPQNCAILLKSRIPPKADTAICTGVWYQDGEEVVMKVRRECAPPATPKPTRYKRRAPMAEYGVQRHEFAIRMRLCPLKVAGRWSLQWTENLCIVTYLDGRKSTSDMEADKNTQDFPPLRFYRVKMFSDAPSGHF